MMRDVFRVFVEVEVQKMGDDPRYVCRLIDGKGNLSLICTATFGAFPLITHHSSQ